MTVNLQTARLAPQSYGIATGQGKRFGGPRGIWLECRSCDVNQVIVGSASKNWEDVTDEQAGEVFRRHGWTGEGPRMLDARCPACSAKQEKGVIASDSKSYPTVAAADDFVLPYGMVARFGMFCMAVACGRQSTVAERAAHLEDAE